MYNGKPMIIACRSTQNTEIGLSFPRLKPRKDSDNVLTDEQAAKVSSALSDPAVKQDYIAKLSVPLSNTEQFIGAFVRNMLKWFTMYNFRIKNLFMIFDLVMADRSVYKKQREEADLALNDIVANAQKRADDGKGNWLTSAIVEEEAMSPANIQSVVAFFRKTPAVNKGTVLELTEAEDKVPDEESDVQKSMDSVNPMASPQEVRAQIQNYDNAHDAALNAELDDIKAQQNEIKEMLQQNKDEKEAEEEKELEEQEKERHDNSFMRQRLGTVSKVFRSLDITGKAFSWFFSSATGFFIKNKLMENFFEWMSKLPLDQIFDFTTLRKKIDEMVFHRIGLHQGSYLYNMTNRFVSHLWFILEPIIKGYGVVLTKLTSMQQTFFAKYSVGVVKYVGGVQNIGHLFYNYYVKLVYIMVAYILSICIGIYFWYIILLLKVIRFILNLILGRFGIYI